MWKLDCGTTGSANNLNTVRVIKEKEQIKEKNIRGNEMKNQYIEEIEQISITSYLAPKEDILQNIMNIKITTIKQYLHIIFKSFARQSEEA